MKVLKDILVFTYKRQATAFGLEWVKDILAFTYKRQDNAFGLEWVTAPSAKGMKDVARQDARESGATHIAFRSRFNQYGLAKTDRQTPPFWAPWRAAAAVLADAIPGTWIAGMVFADGRAWVVAVRNSKIVKGGDELFANEQEAKAHMRGLVEGKTRGWRAIYAPATWGIDGAEQRDLAPYLQRSTSLFGVLTGNDGAGLHPAAMKQWPVSPGKLGLTVVASAALVFYLTHRSALWHGRTAHRPAAVTNAPPPAPEIPSVVSLVRCVEALPAVLFQIAVPGWTTKGATCQVENIVVTVEAKSFTPLSTILAYYPAAVPVGKTKSADITVPFSEVITRSRVTPPLVTEDEVNRIFAPVVEEGRAGNEFHDVSGPVERTQGVRRLQWTFDTSAPPHVWLPTIAKVHNVVLESVRLEFVNAAFQWKLKGFVYVAP